jgi:cell division protein ZapA
MKQLEVTILGQSYLLACPEGGEALLRAAVALVDAEMSAIRDARKVKARERMAVLAALNLAYRLVETPAPQPALEAPPAEARTAGTAAQTPSASAAATLQAPAADEMLPADSTALMDDLIARLDATLAGDGQLL